MSPWPESEQDRERELCNPRMTIVESKSFCVFCLSTGEVEIGSAERAGGRVHAVRPVRVRPQPRGFAVLSRMFRSVPEFRGVVYREVFRQGEIARVGTYVYGSRRWSFKIMRLCYSFLGSRVRSVLHHQCDSKWIKRWCGDLLKIMRHSHSLTSLLQNSVSYLIGKARGVYYRERII